ncbi:MAG: hypothetical protein KGI54_07665 [Pseudomonadota bacterium]|nr:hypothetical protein [Pseudomonadota bacterium]
MAKSKKAKTICAVATRNFESRGDFYQIHRIYFFRNKSGQPPLQFRENQKSGESTEWVRFGFNRCNTRFPKIVKRAIRLAARVNSNEISFEEACEIFTDPYFC